MDAETQVLQQFLAKRDEHAFRILYRAHTPRMLSLAMRLSGGHRSNSEDVVQEAWSRACELLPRFRGDSRLSTWLCGIVVNCFREQQRTVAREIAEDVKLSSPPPGDIDLERLVRRLPDRCREILVLHDIEGYTHDEIGRFLGIAEGTSKHHLFRARQTLIKWLEAARPENPNAPK